MAPLDIVLAEFNGEAVGLESLTAGEVRPYESYWTSAMIVHCRKR
jgi:hypothetical protein